MFKLAPFIVLAAVLIAVLAALVLVCGTAVRGGAVRGGGGADSPQDIVVDTANLAHWVNRRSPKFRLTTCALVEVIEQTAPLLRKKYPGRITYVTKTADLTAARRQEAVRRRVALQAVARRAKVHVSVVERLDDDPSPLRDLKDRAPSHAAQGRDDFYLMLLARRYRCPVLSLDRFRDLGEMKAGNLPPFHVYNFWPARAAPERDFVNPAAAEFKRMGRPQTVGFAEALPHL